MTQPLSAVVLICTYNRAALLGETLDALRETQTTRRWRVLVVDNNSTDQTRGVVESRQAGYPVELAYLFEARQGKSNALNTGLAAGREDVVVFTDDDVLVAPDWVDRACAPFEADERMAYNGGPVLPRWGAPVPRWFDDQRTDLWGTLALLDYGREPFVFEERQRVPLGANMAVRRSLVDRIGGFSPALGRNGSSLLGQEQAEFLARARAAGACGAYVPDMVVRHYVPAARLTKRYFRRWWFWKGVSRARLDLMHSRTELGLDLRSVPHLAGVPRFVFGTLVRSAARWLGDRVRGRRHDAMRAEMMAWFALGYIRARWSSRVRPNGLPIQPSLPSVSR